MAKKGMLVDLLIPATYGSLCSNGGVSSKYAQFVLTGTGMPEIFEVTEEHPELSLVPWYGFYKAIPVKDFKKHRLTHSAGPMFGGCYVTTSDSRFSEITGHHPVPLHDRFET